MTAQEMIYQALAKVGMTEYGTVPTKLYDRTFATLNRVYSDVWRAYPFRDEKLLSATVTTANQDVILPKEVEVIRAARTVNDPLTPLNEIVISNYSPTSFFETGQAYRYMMMPDSPLLIPLSSASKINVASSSAADTATKVTIWGKDSTSGIDVTEQLTLNGTSTVTSANTYSSIISVTKEPTVGNVTIKQGSTVQGYMMAWEDRSLYRRIRLLPSPTAAATYYFECVRRFMPLVFDEEAVLIQKAESVIFDLLVAELFEMNDMYERGSNERNKATGRLQGMIDREEGQEQVDMRSFPVEGMFGDSMVAADTSKTGLWSY